MMPAVIFVTVMVVLFLGTFMLNKNTPAPVDYKISAARCSACSHYGCALKQEEAEES